MATSLSKRASTGAPLNRPVSLAKKRRAAENKELAEKVTLETVLGITCYCGASLSTSESCIAYPAGCVAVLFHPKGKGKQVYIHNRKPISCLSFSPNGSYLATGESGHEPCVRVWDCRSETITQIAGLKEHHHGIQCVAFSPNAKHLVSVGYQHDRQIIVWNWKAGTKLVHGKFANKVNDVAFSSDHSSKGSNYFVTVHNRRVQFWYYNTPSKEDKMNTAVTLKSRSAILSELQQNNFVSVCCGEGALSKNTYALTKSGQLCLFNRNRTLERFTETKTSPAFSLALTEQYLFCGCSNGVIRIFDPYTLDYIITMPRPHPLGIDVASFEEIGQPENEKHVYPDSVAMTIQHNRLSAVYNDHSLYVWDLSNIRQIGGVHSFLFHSAGVWDVCTYPSLPEESHPLLPESSFITCSSDGTVRVWSLDTEGDGVWGHKSAHSKELVRVIYADPEDKLSLKDLSDLPGSATADNTKGVRCIQVHPNGQHIATGDRMGNLVVYDLQFMDEVYKEIAHDSEILSISYSPTIGHHQFLSSASRDRMVHIFSLTDSSYVPIQSLTDHSAAVTAVRFVTNKDGELQLLSSGADKCIIFHSMEESEGVGLTCTFHRSNNVVSKATIYDMDIDVLGKHVVTAGQDRILRFYLVNGGKQRFLIKASPGDSDGALLKVTLDPSGLFAATSCADKSVLIFDVFSGECVAKLTGHSELVTQVMFSRDCKYLYSVSGDSCIFVWRLAKRLTRAMHDRLSEMGRPLPPGPDTPTSSAVSRETYIKRTSTPRVPRPHQAHRGIGQDFKDFGKDDLRGPSPVVEDDVDMSGPDFEFRMSMLPAWARKDTADGGKSPTAMRKSPEEVKSSQENKRVAPVEGRWAERVGDGDVMFAVQKQDSDMSLDDLSAEMSRIVFEKQSMMDVIDLTQDDDERPVSHVTVGEDHVIEVKDDVSEQVDHVTEESNNSKSSDGSDQDIMFFSKMEDIDPSLFSVTTPTKSTNQKTGEQEDSEDDDSSRESPSDSPLLNRDPLVEEDTSFLKTNFESLEKTDENFLSVPSPARLSISARFLEKTLTKTEPVPCHHGNGDQGESPQLTEPAGIVISIQDINGSSQTTSQANQTFSVDDNTTQNFPIMNSQSTTQSNQTFSIENTQATATTNRTFSIEKSQTNSRANQTYSLDDEVSSLPEVDQTSQEDTSTPIHRNLATQSISEGVHEMENMATEEDEVFDECGVVSMEVTSPVPMDREMKRRLSFEVAVDETRKRLEELGYSVQYSKQISQPDQHSEGPDHSPSSMGEHLPDNSCRDQPDQSLSVVEPPLFIEYSPPSSVPDPSPSSASVGSHRSVKVKPRRAAVMKSSPLTSHTQTDMLTKVRSLTESLDSSYRALVELHDQAIASPPQEGEGDKDIVGSISTYLVSHKSSVVSMVNRNRRLWRERAKNKPTIDNSDHTPSKVGGASECDDSVEFVPEGSGDPDNLDLEGKVDDSEEPYCEEDSELKRAHDLATELASILNGLVKERPLYCDT